MDFSFNKVYVYPEKSQYGNSFIVYLVKNIVQNKCYSVIYGVIVWQFEENNRTLHVEKAQAFRR